MGYYWVINNVAFFIWGVFLFLVILLLLVYTTHLNVKIKLLITQNSKNNLEQENKSESAVLKEIPPCLPLLDSLQNSHIHIFTKVSS